MQPTPAQPTDVGLSACPKRVIQIARTRTSSVQMSSGVRYVNSCVPQIMLSIGTYWALDVGDGLTYGESQSELGSRIGDQTYQ